MKPLPHFLPIGCALSLGLCLPAAAQPASSLPTGYTYMQPPPPGYGTYAGAPPKTTAPKPSTTAPRRQASASAPVYGPLPSDSSMQVARLNSTVQDHDSRLRRLEKDVAGIKGGSTRLVSTDTASASLRSHTTYTVKAGDSLWAIASRHRVSPGEIIQLNRMKTDTVVLGQQLLIPGPHGSSSSSTTQTTYKPYYHDVRPGDSSSVIAKKYGVSRQSLMDANPRVDFGGGLIPGSRVIIPGKGTRVSSQVPVSSGSSGTSSSGSYTVQPGDSLKAIAIRHGTSTANLASINGIKDANKLVVGQRLVLPGGKAVSSNRSVASSKPKPVSKPSAQASSDTVPMPGVGLPDGMPPPPSVALPSNTIAETKKSTPPPANTHRGVLAYRVDNTDSIESIASQFSTTPARIREMNHLQSTTKLNAGDEIMVPALGAVSVGN